MTETDTGDENHEIKRVRRHRVRAAKRHIGHPQSEQPANNQRSAHRTANIDRAADNAPANTAKMALATQPDHSALSAVVVSMTLDRGRSFIGTLLSGIGSGQTLASRL